METNYFHGDHDVFSSVNLIFSFGKKFLNRYKSNDRPIIFFELVKMLKDKRECIRICRMLNNLTRRGQSPTSSVKNALKNSWIESSRSLPNSYHLFRVSMLKFP